MTLRPAELGGIEIRLQSTAAGIAAQVVADSPEAARLLTQAGDDLRRALEARNVTLISLDVSTTADQQARQSARGEWADGDDSGGPLSGPLDRRRRRRRRARSDRPIRDRAARWAARRRPRLIPELEAYDNDPPHRREPRAITLDQTKPKDPSNGQLGKDQFLKLFVAQLQHQDPMNPMQDSEFMGQMASFSTLEQVTNLATANEKIAASLDLSNTAVSLIGRTVTWTDSADVSHTGIVEKVTTAGGVPSLTVSGTEGVELGTISQVA